jgi:Acyclic terpene utilisation family protein AtuA
MRQDDKVLRIGCGAAGEPDRPALAMQMVTDGDVDYVCFDTLAERTLASAQLRKRADPTKGYDLMLGERVGALIGPAMERGTRIAGNMGAANPEAAAAVLAEQAAADGVDGVTIATVTGDDVLEAVRDGELPIELWGAWDLDDVRQRLVSANVYLGFLPVLEAFERGADVVVTGRGADVAPYMAAMFHYYRWDIDDLQLRARAAAIGHLLECGRCVTGTCFAEPAFGRYTPDPANTSMPLAEVSHDGSAVITKVPGTGGLVNRISCAEQLIHEINDPARYLTPDVTLDMTGIHLDEVGPDRVRVSGARGATAPDTYKVLLGVDDGFIAEGEASFAGRGAVDKARLAGRIVEDRLREGGLDPQDFRADVIGVDSVLGAASPARPDPFDVRLRLACRVRTIQQTEAFVFECQDLWWAPGVGGGGIRTHVRPILGMVSATVPRDAVEARVTLVEPAEIPIGDAAR